MAYDTDSRSAAQLQAEIDEQRQRVESTIDQIQDKLSPGQLVDELLAYAKGGGGDFVGSLQRNVTANPLPVALLGVSLAWLMAKPAPPPTASADRAWDDGVDAREGDGRADDAFDDDYPIAVISGDRMTRRSLEMDGDGRNYAEFADPMGNTYRAASDSQGRRAGHFTDSAGQRFSGFATSAGERVSHFQDDAGTLLDDAGEWASHTWQAVRERLHDARDAVGKGAGAIGEQSGHAGHAVHDQAGRVNRAIMAQFKDQPLVAGALAFAAGAALGSALPHTAQEDAALGDASDALKSRAGEQADELYEEVREKATDLYTAATEKATTVYEDAKGHQDAR